MNSHSNDHDQRESAERLREYAEQFEKEPEPIDHEEPDERPTIAHLLNGFYRKGTQRKDEQ